MRHVPKQAALFGDIFEFQPTEREKLMSAARPHDAGGSHRRFRRSYFRLAMAIVVVFMLTLIVIQWWKPWLSADERRLLGLWTWQHEPGKMTIHYRADGTMRYVDQPSMERLTFTRWRLEGNLLVVEYSPRNSLDYLFQKLLHRSKFGADPVHIEFNLDGSVSHLRSDGSTIILIPCHSELGNRLQEAE